MTNIEKQSQNYNIIQIEGFNLMGINKSPFNDWEDNRTEIKY